MPKTEAQLEAERRTLRQRLQSVNVDEAARLQIEAILHLAEMIEYAADVMATAFTP